MFRNFLLKESEEYLNPNSDTGKLARNKASERRVCYVSMV